MGEVYLILRCISILLKRQNYTERRGQRGRGTRERGRERWGKEDRMREEVEISHPFVHSAHPPAVTAVSSQGWG